MMPANRQEPGKHGEFLPFQPFPMHQRVMRLNPAAQPIVGTRLA
jgi:hypothetical protein